MKDFQSAFDRADGVLFLHQGRLTTVTSDQRRFFYLVKIMNSISAVKNCDCMDEMRLMPDGFIDLAICDFPYGGGQHFNFRFGVGDSVYRNDKPNRDVFDEIFRVSKNQIFWGGNYFTDVLPVSRCWISWFKGNPLPNFSDIELAWCSFDAVSRQFDLESYGFNHADKRKGNGSTIHPTQKPVALYEWLLKNYAKPGDKILDPMMGSQSSRIAAYKMGFDFWGYEKDADYFKSGCARFEKSVAMPLFDAVKMPEQIKMF